MKDTWSFEEPYCVATFCSFSRFPYSVRSITAPLAHFGTHCSLPVKKFAVPVIGISSCMSSQNDTISSVFTPSCWRDPEVKFGRNWGRCKEGRASSFICLCIYLLLVGVRGQCLLWCHKGRFFFSPHMHDSVFAAWKKSSFFSILRESFPTG